MVDFNWLSYILLIAVGFINVIAALVIIRELSTGSYKRYIEKREYHLEQLRRIEKQLKIGEKHD
jgi:hypothetical protein